MKRVKILWADGVHCGTVSADGAEFRPSGRFETDCLELFFERAEIEPGGNPTIVTVRTDRNSFSFLLRDVRAEYPVYIPQYSVIVTEAADSRSFEEIAAAIRAKGGKTKLQRIEEREEYSFEEAARITRNMPCPTWLGISRDMRIFEVGLRGRSCGDENMDFDYVRPMRYAEPETPPELRENEARYRFMAGRGIGCRHEVTRRLEDGCLPILNAWNVDDDILYEMQFFAAPERTPMKTEHIRGTDMYIADNFGRGHMFTEEQQRRVDSLLEDELEQDEETVMYIRIRAVNRGKAPAFSYVKLPDPMPYREHKWIYKDIPEIVYDPKTGFSSFVESGRVFCISSLGGKPVPQEEMVVQLAPGEAAEYVFKIPHKPLDPDRATALSVQDCRLRLEEAKTFWRSELENVAEIRLPEKRIEEMIRAGILHVDMSYFGKNPDAPVVPIVGVYTGIGSESAPGIQFLDTIGMTGLAERALGYFIEKQHDDGFMQNFGGYMLETGSVLWTMGEHFRVTRDTDWLDGVKDCVIKACGYLLRWRESNKREEFRGGRGYGMIDGKTSDPEDPYHSFMLNAGAYVGLSRAAEMLEQCDKELAGRFRAEASAWREDILETLRENLAVSPVLPMGDGTWSPAPSPWAEMAGPASMLLDGGKCYSHANFLGRDMTGTIYLILQEVIEPEHPLADIILGFYSEHLAQDNTCFSQPYYSPHPYVHLHRGEVKPFLMEFYSGIASLADRETYSFWEHYYHVSPHKLHEETWFLMRCRWMLMAENFTARKLKLLGAVPRRWMADGETILVRGMRSYFGTISYEVYSEADSGRITVDLRMDSDGFPAPEQLEIRVPHPDGRRAKSVSLGQYNPERETVLIPRPAQSLRLEVIF